MPTPISNRISLDISDADMQAILAAIATLREKLQPHLVDLDAEDRKSLPKMGPKTVDFVDKTLNYARAHPEYRPAFVDVDEFARDLAAVGALRSLLQPLSLLTDMVDDSLVLSGSEAYAAALACYQSFKAAARMGLPGAAVIADDLSERFPRSTQRVAPGTAPGAAHAGQAAVAG